MPPETQRPDRARTRVGQRGSLDGSTGSLHGDLVVLGGGDPDFHVENAYLVARALENAGVSEVSGSLLVDDRFWIGWEGGSGYDTARRAVEMAGRLRDALDPARWSRRTRQSLDEFRSRRGLDGEPLPAVRVRGEGSRYRGSEEPAVLLVHRSNPLRITLKRLNSYSNNDIERLGAGIGTTAELATFLAARWKDEGQVPSFETFSGLGVNRMTCRQVVLLLRDLHETCEELEIGTDAVLPVAGCDPGTLKHFPRLADEGVRGAVVAKTGTLTTTDDGVAAFAGYARTESGLRLFCVASPGIGREVRRAREAQQRWLLELFDRQGGPQPEECGPPVVYSDTAAVVELSPSPPAR